MSDTETSPNCLIMKNLLLVIDAQYDFCNPEGALYVLGAEKDMQRLAQFVRNNSSHIDHIIATLDNHPIYDISHPDFWEDAQGNPPAPFTEIKVADVEAGKWTPRIEPQKALAYLRALEQQGEFPHFIWTRHCLVGSQGAALDATFFAALTEWAIAQNKDYQTVEKGMYPFSEHFGVFAAQIPEAQVPYTHLRTDLLTQLAGYDAIYVAGEAQSHCVATSIKQILDNAPELASKLVILEDCMSDVPNMGHLALPIYQKARAMGAKYANSQTII
jgi:nicotinamidase/pyrazinamidase